MPYAPRAYQGKNPLRGFREQGVGSRVQGGGISGAKESSSRGNLADTAKKTPPKRGL